MTDYDSPWKEALERYFEAFVAFYFPAIHTAIDWSRGFESLDKELQQIVGDAKLGKRLADKLVRVWRKDGQETWVLIHIEVQSQEEAEFGKRMYVYHYRIFDRYDHLVVSLAVLGDGNPNWRPSHFGYELWGCRLGFDFAIAKLVDFRKREKELARDANPFAIVTLAHLKAMETSNDPAARGSWKVRLVKSLYDHRFTREDVAQLYRLIDWMMKLPEELNEKIRDEIWRYQEEKRMPYITSIERIGMKKGHRKGLLDSITVGLRQRFGEKGLALLEEIREIKEAAVLKKVVEALFNIDSLDDLRRVYSRKR